MSTLADSPRITPFLWFDSNAEEAADFYVSIFPNSRRVGETAQIPATRPALKGAAMAGSRETAG
jgi:predicted 3-demethylubiquinone-9 3-methyltransferase (glyoxalase superfamily)